MTEAQQQLYVLLNYRFTSKQTQQYTLKPEADIKISHNKQQY